VLKFSARTAISPLITQTHVLFAETKGDFFVLQRYYFLFLSIVLCLAPFLEINAQEKNEKAEKPKQEKPKQFDIKNLAADQLAETVIIAYGGFGGRNTLSQIRKTEVERGELKRFASDGVTVSDKSTYERRITRGDNIEKDRVRIDQKLPQAEYALIYDTTKTFGLFNNAIFTPREEADRSFKANIFHSLDTLLRYKENGSTLNLVGKDKQMNVEFYILDVTDKQKRTTRFNISAKMFRVQSLEYSMATAEGATPTKFVRKYYDYRAAQGTLVPYRTVLYVDGKPIEEANTFTVSFGTKIEETAFQAAE
jgi:hypothetical protein